MIHARRIARLAMSVLVVSLVSGLLLRVAWTGTFGNRVGYERAHRAAAESDLPRIWFDGRVSDVGSGICEIREEHRHGRSGFMFERYLTNDPIPVHADSNPAVIYTAQFQDFDSEATTTVTAEELSNAFEGSPPPQNNEVRFVKGCAFTNSRVRVDCCVADDHATLVRCAGGGMIGMIDAAENLEEKRHESFTMSAALVVAFPLVFMFGLMLVLGRSGVFRLGEHFEPLVSARDKRSAILVSLVVPLALAIVAVALHAPIIALIVAAAPLIFFVTHMNIVARFYSVIAQLHHPPEGYIVVEGNVDAESAVHASVLRERQVVLSSVAVARIVRDQFIGVGVVDDVGALDVTTDAGTIKLDLENAILELDVDETIEMTGEEIPNDVATQVGALDSERYRLRERSLERGDAITILVHGARVDPTNVSASVYRAAPKTASLDVDPHARPVIFEGAKNRAFERLERKLIRAERWAAVFGGIATAELLWTIAVARIL